MKLRGKPLTIMEGKSNVIPFKGKLIDNKAKIWYSLVSETGKQNMLFCWNRYCEWLIGCYNAERAKVISIMTYSSCNHNSFS